jgi:hypothetical protein
MTLMKQKFRKSTCLFAPAFWLAVGAVTPGCQELGVQGGAQALQTKFPGIGSVTVLSPTAVAVKWTPLDNYVGYNIYISSQDAPVGNSRFDTFTLANLTPGTAYTFSVAGIRKDGSQDGIGKQIQASTWTRFMGPTSATTKDSSSIAVAWNYLSGPNFQVYYHAGSPPDLAQLQGPPSFSSQSPTGATIGGLESNTTYYFAVIAKYPDNTDSLQALSIAASQLAAQFTSSQLQTHPTLTTDSTVISTIPPAFTIAGAPATYQTTFYEGALPAPASCPTVPPVQVLATRIGNGAANSSAPLALGLHNIFVQVKDTASNSCAYAVFSNLLSDANPAQSVPTVSATTPTSLSPLPVVKAPAINLGPFPTFTVTGALSNYKTLFTYNGTSIATINGNGTATTLTNTPLPQGNVSIEVTVTANGMTAHLEPLAIRIKSLDSLPVSPPTQLNANGTNGGLGTSMAVGDYNCDGYQDVAVGIPYGAFSRPKPYRADPAFLNGAVAVYYGSPAGLVGIDTRGAGAAAIAPVTNPTGKNPLLITEPDGYNLSRFGGIYFGHALAAGSIKGSTSGPYKCSDLAIGATHARSDLISTADTGAVYLYYGSPAGLQVTSSYIFNGISCPSSNSFTCATGKISLTGNDFITNNYDNFGNTFGYAVALGDFNGDGFDDLATSHPSTMSNDGSEATKGFGTVFLYFGTSNGLSPIATRIRAPKNDPSVTVGNSLTFGYFTDKRPQDIGVNYPDTAAGAGSQFRKKDLIIGNYAGSNATGRSGVIWLRGTANVGANLSDAYGHLDPAKRGPNSGWDFIQPQQCRSGQPQFMGVEYSCGYETAAADLNSDGWDDLLFSAPLLTGMAPYNELGAFFVYYGSDFGVATTVTPVKNATTCTSPQNPIGCAPQVFAPTDGNYYWKFGSFVSNLGDLNGDGFPEIGVGAQGAAPRRNGYVRNGVAYVYNSSAYGLTGSFSQINLNSPPFSLFGTSLVGGDFRHLIGENFLTGTCTGKKCNDILIGAPGESSDPYATGYGVAHYFRNAGSGIGTRSADDGFIGNIKGKAAASRFQYAKFVGDLNGDGYADLASPYLVADDFDPGDQYGRINPSYRSNVVIYYGGPNGFVTLNAQGSGPQLLPLTPTDPQLINDRYISGGPFNRNFGNIVFAAGDVNGDGYSDLGLTFQSQTFIYHGSSSGVVAFGGSPDSSVGLRPKATPDSPLDPKLVSDTASTSGATHQELSTSGDFNGDGYSDIVLGYWPSSYVTNVTVFYGSHSGIVAGGNVYFSSNAGSYAAEPNLANKAVRTPSCSGTWPEEICQPLLICPVATAGYACADASNAAERVNGATGWGAGQGVFSIVMNVGDIDKDGTDDLALGSPYVGPNGADVTGGADAQYQGALFLMYGSQSSHGLSPSRYVRLNIPTMITPNPTGGRYLGHADYGSLARGYDINGDGVSDIVLSASRETPLWSGSTSSNTGVAYVIYGINGGYINAGVGCSTYPCSINMANIAQGGASDHRADHIVTNVNDSCSPADNKCNPLRFFPFGVSTNSWSFGRGALGLGDLTGDAYGEVVVGALGLNSNLGGAFIYSGTQSGLSVVAATSAQPKCVDGICTPYRVNLPADPSYTSGSAMYWNINSAANVGDVDKDGKRDFFFSTFYAHDPGGNGFFNGGLFLFR